jgi:NADH-quinone oxidoreductase subunit M
MSDLPLLSLVVALPLVGAIVALFLPRMAGWWWALLVGLLDLAGTVAILAQFQPGKSGYQIAERSTWLPEAGINWSLGVDGVNLFLIALNALLTVLAIAASRHVARDGDRSRQYFALMLLLSGGMQGVFLATNLALFYVFWEVMLVPAYLLVGMYGGPRRAYAAIKFVLYTAIGSLLMLIGIIVVASLASGRGAGVTFELPALIAAGVPEGAQFWLFLAFAAAFAVKAGLFPLHSWAPDTYAEAPTAVVVLIAGVMAKTGAYGFVRFCLPLFPIAVKQVAPVVGVLAVIGILYFALQALVADDMQRLLAYVSLSHMSVILLAIFAFNAQAYDGAIMQMVNHGIIIAALFLIAGVFEARTGSRRLSDFGGLALRVPLLATAFMLASLAALGLPGLNSFAGEFLAFLGAFRTNWVLGALATLVVIPAAWYMLRFFQGMMFGPDVKPASASNIADIGWIDGLTLAPLLALIVVLGLFPGILTARIEPSITAPTLTSAMYPIRVFAGGEVSSSALRSLNRSGDIVTCAASEEGTR